jgi:hypothetical protein
MSNWKKNFDFGTKAEDLIRDYFEEVFGWLFVAGAYRGKIENPEKIEKLFSCEFLPAGNYEDGFHGPRLEFSDNRFVMPDQLYKSKNDIIFWVESKARKNFGQLNVMIEETKILDYLEISNRSTKSGWLVLSLVDEKKREKRTFIV